MNDNKSNLKNSVSNPYFIELNFTIYPGFILLCVRTFLFRGKLYTIELFLFLNSLEYFSYLGSYLNQTSGNHVFISSLLLPFTKVIYTIK